MDETAVAEALAAVRAADQHVTRTVEEAQQAQREAADARALAVARLVDVAGREGAASALDLGVRAIDKATQRAKAIRRSEGGE